MPKVIVVGVDGSPAGYVAVSEAAELARRYWARLIGISVEEGLPRAPATMGEVDEFIREKDQHFAEVGKRAIRLAARHGADMEHQIRIGRAGDAIVRFAEEVGADLVVLGYKGHSRVTEIVTGSTTQKVNACSKASVLIVKPQGSIEELSPRNAEREIEE